MRKLLYGILLAALHCLILAGCASTGSQRIYPLSRPEIPPFMAKQGVGYKGDEEKSRYLIIVDAGHGGEDFGAHSMTKPKYQEKHLNLSTAKMLNSFLTQQGYRTIMTRNDDRFIALDKRAEFANEKNPTLFVSVHYNSAPSKEAEGIEVYFYRDEQDKKRTRDSRFLAQSILDNVIEHTQAKSRGIKHGNFAVIRETKMPAILIEGGFLTNEKEIQRIKDPLYLKKLAWGIAQGINAYFDN